MKVSRKFKIHYRNVKFDQLMLMKFEPKSFCVFLPNIVSNQNLVLATRKICFYIDHKN